MIQKNSILKRTIFFLNGLQNFLVFQLFISHFLSKNGKTFSWKSKGMSE